MLGASCTTCVAVLVGRPCKSRTLPFILRVMPPEVHRYIPIAPHSLLLVYEKSKIKVVKAPRFCVASALGASCTSSEGVPQNG